MNNKSLGMLEKYFDTAFDSPNGIKELRNLILKLAMKGKLVPQDPNDQPASELLKEIQAEKGKLIPEGKIKKQKPLPEIKPEEVPYKLPEGWIWCRLGKTGEVQTGTTPPTKDPQNYGGFIPFIGPGDIQKYEINLLNNGLSKKGMEKGRIITKNSILMVCIGGSIGKLAINKVDLTCNQQINTITPFADNTYYLFYILSSEYFQSAVISCAGGSATPIINKNKWSSIIIPLPPLNEQKRIVTKINELMARCDEMERLKQEQIEKQIKTNTSVVHQMMESRNNNNFKSNLSFITNNFSSLYIAKKNVEGLKKSILQLAMKGKLVPQDPNDQPATELLKKIQIEKEKLISEGKIKKQKASPEIKPGKTPYKLPEGWIWCRLGDIGLIGSSSRVLQKDWRTKGIPFYRAREIVMLHKQGRVNNSLFIDEDLYIHLGKKGMLPESDDIMLTAVGTIGVPYIVTTKDRFYFKDASVLIFKNYFKMPAVFLKNFFISPFWINNIHKNSMGTTVHTLTITRAKATLFPLPPLNEQKRIVKKINELMALCDNIIDKIDLSEEKREKLLQSVLAKV